MKSLTRDSLLDLAKEVKVEKVKLNKDTNVFVKEMTGEERNLFEGMLVRQVGTGGNVKFHNTLDNYREKLCAMTLCDEKGTLLYKKEEYKDLGKVPARYLDIIVKAAQKVNNITQEDKEKLAKN